jgi:hypothetical protein
MTEHQAKPSQSVNWGRRLLYSRISAICWW